MVKTSFSDPGISERKPDVVLNVYHEEQCIKKRVAVVFRPGLPELLIGLREHFELVLFTAGRHEYAHEIVTAIHKHVGAAVFNHIVSRDGLSVSAQHKLVVKDLRLLLTPERDIRDIIIVDNKASCFALHISNGVPIKDFEGSMEDRELEVLLPYLLSFRQEEDVRVKIKFDFNLYQHLPRRLTNNSYLAEVPSPSRSPGLHY